MWAERLLATPGGSLWALQLMREQLLMAPIQQGDLVEDNIDNANTFAQRLVDAARAQHGDGVADAIRAAWGAARYMSSCGKWVPGCTIVKEVKLELPSVFVEGITECCAFWTDLICTHCYSFSEQVIA